MSRAAIDVGAFSWTRIQRLYDADVLVHWQRCETEGLQCPQDVFTQLFHEKANDEEFAVIVRSVDWGRVRWELTEFWALRCSMYASIGSISWRWTMREITRSVTESWMREKRLRLIGKRRTVGSSRRWLCRRIF